MEHQPPLKFNPERISVLNTAAFLPPSKDYSTVINLFPGNNAHEPWGKEGTFFVSLNLYQKGKLVSKIHTPSCTEKGNIRLHLDEFMDLNEEDNGVMIMEYHHAKDIPVEAYTNYIHRKTSSYFSTNAIAFIGDKLYPQVHDTQLENTLFWPGILCNESVETRMVVINPYTLTFSFQIHLFLEDGTRKQTSVLSLKAHTSGTYSLEELFPDDAIRLRDFDQKNSICIASQYKQISYAMIQDRETGIITTMDHLHNYCLH
jgi:hypothetical protein